MLSHVCIGIHDFDRAFSFYTEVMSALGHELKFRELDRPWAGWMAKGQPRPLFIIGTPNDGNPAQSGNGRWRYSPKIAPRSTASTP